MENKEKKNVKWKNTDKKIVQIVYDLYTNDPLYPIIYRELEKFFDPVNGIDEPSYNKIRTVEYGGEGNLDQISWPSDSFQDLFFYSMKPTKEEFQIYINLSRRSTKAVDIQKKYWISNVTLKARLKDYFWLLRVQEWKVGYLWVILTHEGIIGVALYNYFESKEGQKQTGIIKTFSLLKENK